MEWHDDHVEHSNRSGWAVWTGMTPYFRPYRGYLLLLLAVMCLGGIIDAAIPLYQKYIIDNFIVKETMTGIWLPALLGVLAMSCSTFMVIILGRVAIRIEMFFTRDLRKACFDHLQTLSLAYYNVTPVGFLIARVMSDTGRIGMLIAWGFIDIAWGLTYVLFAAVAMLSLNLRLGLALLALVPVMAVITNWFQKHILHSNREVRRINTRVTGSFNEGIGGARTSKTLNAEQINIDDFSKLSSDMYRSSIWAAAYASAFMPIIAFFGALATAIILTRAGHSVMLGNMAFGTLSALVSYAISIFEPIQNMARIFAEIVAVRANIERVENLLAKQPDITDSPQVVARYGDETNPKRQNWEPLIGEITFEDVTFRYPDGGENVLEHFNLHIPAGTNVALVGETGAGKSTLVNLVCRFFEPTSGRILIDGRDYRERSQLWLRSNIGYVLQSPHLFSGSVRENIRYGKLDATDEEIRAALEAVSALEIVQKLPKGLDSEVGEGGDRLSTGEKQLLSFARAVLAMPRIFVLDEATSSIDTETELLIQKAIAGSLRGRTSFLIAHRLSTIKMADMILVVRGGKIVERGTHASLIRKGGYYRSLYSLQFERESLTAVTASAAPARK